MVVVRRFAAGLALVALLAACTETMTTPAPASGAPARPVLVSNGAVKVGTRPAVAAVGSPTPVSPAPTRPPSPASAPAVGQPAGSAAVRELAQVPPGRPKPAATKPAATKSASTTKPPAGGTKPGQTTDEATSTTATGAEPTPIPKPTMRPAHIPRRDTGRVFAPGRTSFVKERGRDGIGFYRPGELTPAPHVYGVPPAPEPEFFDDGEEVVLEEGTP